MANSNHQHRYCLLIISCYALFCLLPLYDYLMILFYYLHVVVYSNRKFNAVNSYNHIHHKTQLFTLETQSGKPNNKRRLCSTPRILKKMQTTKGLNKSSSSMPMSQRLKERSLPSICSQGFTPFFQTLN